MRTHRACHLRATLAALLAAAAMGGGAQVAKPTTSASVEPKNTVGAKTAGGSQQPVNLDTPFDRVLRDFAKPARAYSPVPIWWWSGERLQMPRLEWQMDRMLEGHVYNTVILNLAPSGPLYGSQPDSPPFFSPQWWGILRGVLDRAKARGMHVWLYDQLGFSTAHIQDRLMDRDPSWRAPDLRVLEKDITGPQLVRLTSPGKAVAACAVPLNGTGAPEAPIADISSSMVGGYLTKRMPAGNWRIMLFYEAPGGFDYMSVVAAGKLLNFVHGEYERKLGAHLGTTVAGTFQDELPPMNRWTRDFATEFRARKGYDLRPWLPMLWYDLGSRTAKVRCDVADVQTALLERAFFKPLYEWHERHHMLCSYDQATRDADPIEANRYYVDYMRTMRWFQAPGNDQTGLSRPHSSLAHLYRRPRVWLEGFCNSGWGQTVEEISDRIHEFFGQGANLYNPHAWYYTTLAGWWEWAPPCTSFRQPYWKHYPLFADYVSRMSYLLSAGSHVCDIAVLYPSSTIHAGGTHTGTYDAAATRSRDVYRQVCSELDKRGADYDVLDEASLLHGHVASGTLRVADERYKCVLLPSATTLPRSGADKLAALARTGGFIAAVGPLPSASREGGVGDPFVLNCMRPLFGTASSQASSIPGGGDTVAVAKGCLFARDGVAPLVEAVVKRLPNHAAGVDRYIHRRVAGKEVYFLVASSRGEIPVSLKGTGKATLLLPWTGRAIGLPVAGSAQSRSVVNVDFGESRAVFVVLGADHTAPSRRQPPTSAQPHRASAMPASPLVRQSRRLQQQSPLPSLTLGNEWESALVQTLDNRWGDFAHPPSAGAPPVECRRFSYREEAAGENGLDLDWYLPETRDDSWQKVTATFGTYWWITKPGMGEGDLKLPGPEDGDWRPDRTIWQPAVFSLRYGIEKDPVYSQWLGPKGRVPDEYLDFGTAPAGTLRFAVTFLHMDQPCDVLIKCGAGDARVAINSKWLPADRPLIGHLLAGYNAITVQFRHPASGTLRTYVHVGPVTEVEEGPDWIWTAQRTDVSDCYARRTFMLEAVPRAATLSITADNGYEVYVNGVRVGRDVGQGSEHWSVAERYSVGHFLRRGRNVIAVHAMNTGGPAGLAAALRWREGSGPASRWQSIVTNSSWRVTASRPSGSAERWLSRSYDDSRWETATVVGHYPCEPWGVVQGLRREEPSVLPESGWLNGEVREWAPGLVIDPKPGIAKPVGWYRFRTPPGATSMKLSIAGRYRVFVQGRECAPDTNDRVEIPVDLQGPSLTAALRIEQAAGHYEGAAVRVPVRFTVGPGTIRCGNWASQGLPHYSGGMTYAQTFELPAAYADRTLLLDIGRVRGTAEVVINGRNAGVRIWRPYRFNVTGLLRAGPNRIEITVYNTLGPHFGAGYPSPYVYDGQEVSGMFGPVRLMTDGQLPLPRVDLTGLTNVALAERGAIAVASSEHPSGLYLADSVVAGHITGERWAKGGGWNDATEGEFPDWIEVGLPTPTVVRAVKIITLEPAARYGIRDFDVLCQRGDEWVRCAEVRDNEDIAVTVGVPSIRTNRVRVVVYSSNDEAYSRIIAVQVFAAEGASAP